METYRKKLIEVALPLEAINKASAREKSIRHGHPSTLHLWWARRPLAAARAVIFAQMVDDPSAHPDKFPNEEAQGSERQRLFRLIEELVKWENTTNETLLSQAREEIWRSWRTTCAENTGHPRVDELFDPDTLPGFHDPFAGGGSLPLEAQRLGLESFASDLNPVAVLICKAMIEIPPKFAGRTPVNPEARKQLQVDAGGWKGAQGIAEDVAYYGRWMRNEAEKRIGDLYPKVEVTEQMARERPDLRPLVGRKLSVVAWLWARTVKSPNPAFARVEVPLVSTFLLSTKAGKEAFVEPVIDGGHYRFTVKQAKPEGIEAVRNGTKLARANFVCLMSGAPITGDYIMAEGKAGRIGTRLMATVAESERGRIYLPPTEAMESVARKSEPGWKPDVEFFQQALGFRVGNYGMAVWSDLFTPRQLLALATFADLVQEARDRVKRDAIIAGLPDDGKRLASTGTGATAYADAVGTYLGLAVSKTANRASTLCTFKIAVECPGDTFGRQALPMSWDYAEANTLGGPSGSFQSMVSNVVAGLLSNDAHSGSVGHVEQLDASSQSLSLTKIVSTDPPYYDNIGYADLSDFFYVWLRRALKPVFPDLFATLAVPKAEELVATPGRHGGSEEAEVFFLDGMTRAMHRLSQQAHPAFPVTLFYAFKQSESESDAGTASTGWETFLDAAIQAGFAITGTWPVRTERENRKRNQGANALASSIVLVCRPRPDNAPLATRREFATAMKRELPGAIRKLKEGSIAPVDMAQACIGPGMAVFSRYSKVIEADGSPMSVRVALQLINGELEAFLRQEGGEADRDTQFCVSWFEQYGMEAGPFGEADVLARAKNTSVEGLVQAGVVTGKGGRVALLPRSTYSSEWDPATDNRLSLWECTQQLVRRYQEGGETAASTLHARLGPGRSEDAKNLAYRLYAICERKGWAEEALAYNEFVVARPEILRKAAALAGEGPQKTLQVEDKE